MGFDLFKKSIADFLPYLLKVNLYDEGEPMLNREICKMAAWLSQNNVGSCISSNFSMKLSDERLKELATCGLEHLIVAVDGGSQETYSRYRVGGDLSLVVSNLKRLMEVKRQTPSSQLDVELQFIEFEHNRHELDIVQQLAREACIPRFTIIQGSSVHGWDGTDFIGSESERRRLGCHSLWVSSHINNDGSLFTCDYGEDHGMQMLGWAWDFKSSNLRNHPQAVALRDSFKRENDHLDKVCSHCSIYKNGIRSTI